MNSLHDTVQNPAGNEPNARLESIEDQNLTSKMRSHCVWTSVLQQTRSEAVRLVQIKALSQPEFRFFSAIPGGQTLKPSEVVVPREIRES